MKEISAYYTQAFSSIRHKSKRRSHTCNITKPELIRWLIENGLESLWKTYSESNYDKELKPSIDRIDDYKPYVFDNMQLITWRENRIKGVNGVKHHIATSAKNKASFSKKVFQFNKDYVLLNTFNSLKEASEFTGIHNVDIQRVCSGQRKQSHGYYFSYTEICPKTHRSVKHKLSKTVDRLDSNGKFVDRWESISFAGLSLGINPSSISGACSGRLNVVGGYMWRFTPLAGSELVLSTVPEATKPAL